MERNLNQIWDYNYSIMIEKDDLIKKVKEVVEEILKSLDKKGISYFKTYPTAEIAHRGEKIWVSLIDESNSEINCLLNQDLRRGKLYFSIAKGTLLNPIYNITILVQSQIKKIEEELNQNTAFNTNLERVARLIEDKHYAVALVFIVSAFESVTSDIFYQYNHLWFRREIILSQNYNDEELIKHYGVRREDLESEHEIFFEKEINGQKWVITRMALSTVNRWLNLRVWEYIFNVCGKLRIYDQYLKRLLGNKLKEIREFDILKSILKESQDANRGINFQSLKSVGKVYNKFFKINFESIINEISILEGIFKMRHKIIHGNLRDDEVDKESVEKAIDALKKVVGFLYDQINTQEYSYSAYGIFFE